MLFWILRMLSLRVNITKYLTKWVSRFCNLCGYFGKNDSKSVQTHSTVHNKSKSSEVIVNCGEMSASV